MAAIETVGKVQRRASGAPLLKVVGLTRLQLGPVELELAAGETVGITGASGSGKSLLLRSLADLDPHDGEVWLDGRSRSETAPSQWRRQVGFLPAESQWWEELVGEHFHGLPAQLARFGFTPEVMEWDVARCSTGERQRLALLRLLQNRPRVLLLDEPTASVDPEATAAMEAVIGEYRREAGAGVIWVSHDPAQVERVADRHLVIRSGRLGAAQ